MRYPTLVIMVYSIFCVPVLVAQGVPKLGVPRMEAYHPSDYLDAGKVWDIGVSPSGILYMASDDGLLEYDGDLWKLHHGAKGNTRSIYVDQDSVIYTGSDFDFGRWSRNEHNGFVYRSLYPFSEVAGEKSEEFWGVDKIGESMVFVAFDNLYVYDGSVCTRIPAPHRFSKHFMSKGALYLADEVEGLFRFDGATLTKIFGYPQQQPCNIVGVLESDSGLLIVTRKQGLFRYESNVLEPWETEVSRYLQENEVFSFTTVGEGYLAFGTILNGLYVTDPEGRVYQHINKQRGLLSNTVLDLFCSPNGELWMSKDYGLCAIDLRSNITYFYDQSGEYGTGYTAALAEGYFYLGTNQGLYRTTMDMLSNGLDPPAFELLPGTAGQVWSLEVVDGVLLCGHDKGLLVVSGLEVQKVHDEPGVWTICSFGEDYLLTGNYDGVCLFHRERGDWQFVKKIDKILGSCSQIVVENDSVFWVSIPNFGLIRTTLGEDHSTLDRKIFLESMFQGSRPVLAGERKEDRICVRTSTTKYGLDPSRMEFVPMEQPPGVLRDVDGRLSVYHRPVDLDDQYVFYPVYNGFALENLDRRSADSGDYSVLIRKVEAFNNEENREIINGAEVPYLLHNLRLRYILPQTRGTSYQYRIDNGDAPWIDVGTENEVELVNLKEGRHKIDLRASRGHKTYTMDSFSFRILPPWHRTYYAYAAYVLGALAMLYLYKIGSRKRLERREAELLLRNQEALDRQAEEYERKLLKATIAQAEEDKSALESQMKKKTLELAKKAKQNKDKNRLIQALRDKIDEIHHKPSLTKQKIAELRRLLDDYVGEEDKLFEMQIDQMHQDFFRELQSLFPDLSLYDMRLCAYLKMGLNSKEISDLLKIQYSSVNMSRSRLRKKLHLLPEDDLYHFLNQL